MQKIYTKHNVFPLIPYDLFTDPNFMEFFFLFNYILYSMHTAIAV